MKPNSANVAANAAANNFKAHANAWALAALLGASAVNHVRNPTFYYPVVPP